RLDPRSCGPGRTRRGGGRARRPEGRRTGRRGGGWWRRGSQVAVLSGEAEDSVDGGDVVPGDGGRLVRQGRGDLVDVTGGRGGLVAGAGRAGTCRTAATSS